MLYLLATLRLKTTYTHEKKHVRFPQEKNKILIDKYFDNSYD
jgi:hypothetical protein